jgi:hypothetical protein
MSKGEKEKRKETILRVRESRWKGVKRTVHENNKRKEKNKEEIERKEESTEFPP